VHSESEKLVVTLLVIRGFSDLLGAPIACVDCRDSTDFSRVMGWFFSACTMKLDTTLPSLGSPISRLLTSGTIKSKALLPVPDKIHPPNLFI